MPEALVTLVGRDFLVLEVELVRLVPLVPLVALEPLVEAVVLDHLVLGEEQETLDLLGPVVQLE